MYLKKRKNRLRTRDQHLFRTFLGRWIRISSPFISVLIAKPHLMYPKLAKLCKNTTKSCFFCFRSQISKQVVDITNIERMSAHTWWIWVWCWPFWNSEPFWAKSHHQKWSLWLNLVKSLEYSPICYLLLYQLHSFSIFLHSDTLTHTHTRTHTYTHTHTPAT